MTSGHLLPPSFGIVLVHQVIATFVIEDMCSYLGGRCFQVSSSTQDYAPCQRGAGKKAVTLLSSYGVGSSGWPREKDLLTCLWRVRLGPGSWSWSNKPVCV